ncbi:hypothetical protein LY76DRAFT_587737 [Colletotrichum caudatum]|nr:hypothetical protein LY76DRAFT_587737 [Colletotrichum caudatum]
MAILLTDSGISLCSSALFTPSTPATTPLILVGIQSGPEFGFQARGRFVVCFEKTKIGRSTLQTSDDARDWVMWHVFLPGKTSF